MDVNPTFLAVVGACFVLLSLVGICFAIWATNETTAHKQSRLEREQRQDWVSAQFQRRQRDDAAYRENALAKIDASRRSPVRKVA